MAVFKCKMCGGTLEFNQGESVGVCEYCGTKQTLPNTNDDVISNLFNRANNLRMKGEFDRASKVYEDIVNKDDSQAEAHWGIVLCKYGIEYVEDPATGKRIPTCHRASYEAIRSDADYQAAIDYADGEQQSIYEAEAREIDKIQKGILAIAKEEKPFDVFICYKETDESGKRTIDSTIANDIYYQLTQEGFKVFYAAITLEDKLGQEYEPYIFAALNSAKVMLVLGTKPEYFNAVWVKNEWSRYLKLIKNDRSRLLIPCYRDMDAYDIPEEFAHLQAQDMSKIGFINDVTRGIRKLLADTKEQHKETVIVSGGTSEVEPLLKRAFMFLEDGDWENADQYCERVLDLDPENAKAYLGKLMVELNIRIQEELIDCEKPYVNNNNFIKAKKYADSELSELINSISTRAEEREKEAERVFEKTIEEVVNAFKTLTNHETITTIKEKLTKENKNYNKLGAVLKQFDENLLSISNLKNERNEIQKNIEILTNKRESLGVFALKNKKNIDNEIEISNQKVKTINNELQKFENALCNYSSKDKLVGDIEKSNLKIQELNTRLDELSNSTKCNMSFEEAHKIFKSDESVREAIVKMYTKSTIVPRPNSGSALRFGNYYNESNSKKEPIAWKVIDTNNGTITLLSKYALTCMYFSSKEGNTDWGRSDLRWWLNNTFLAEAFSSIERKIIVPTKITNSENPHYKTSTGQDTEDKVYLLSFKELTQFSTTIGSDMNCTGTKYTATTRKKNEGYNTKNNCYYWWLRSPGDAGHNVAAVNYYGQLEKEGYMARYFKYAVRPVIQLDYETYYVLQKISES